ncbi:small secreted protein [Streptomyces sp. NPDC051561]|uniref:small secreted protein n=1 Tax=Streptomyces sp. NPDC051561 TaxID=3365658 RepID=UPI00379C2885
MNKKLAAALSGGAVLVMMTTLTACGDSPEEKAQKEAEAWSKSYCPKEKASLDKRQKADKTIADTTADGEPEDIKKADSAAIQQMVDADKEWITALRAAGAPPVKDGAASHKRMIQDLEKGITAFTELKKQSDALDTKDLGKFSKGLDKLGADLGKATKVTNQRVFCPSNAGKTQ